MGVTSGGASVWAHPACVQPTGCCDSMSNASHSTVAEDHKWTGDRFRVAGPLGQGVQHSGTARLALRVASQLEPSQGVSLRRDWVREYKEAS